MTDDLTELGKIYRADFAKLTTRRGWAWVCGCDKCAGLPSHQRYAVGPFRTRRAAERDFEEWFSTDPEAKAHTTARMPESAVPEHEIDFVTNTCTRIVRQ